jgi:dTMP kinase
VARGAFITIEGGEGAGKSTQARRLVAWLERQGVRAVATREPGGTPTGEQIRDLVMHRGPAAWHPLTETLLFFAARREHLDRVILPALATGRWVVCDRFADSTMAYQGYGAGLGPEPIAALYDLVVGAIKPDLTLILDLPLAAARRRLKRRAGASDRFERRRRAYHERVRAGFLAIAARDRKRCAVIDATQPADAVAAAIERTVRRKLDRRLAARRA